MGSEASRSSNLRGFLDPLDASDRVDVATVLPRVELLVHASGRAVHPRPLRATRVWSKRALYGQASPLRPDGERAFIVPRDQRRGIRRLGICKNGSHGWQGF